MAKYPPDHIFIEQALEVSRVVLEIEYPRTSHATKTVDTPYPKLFGSFWFTAEARMLEHVLLGTDRVQKPPLA